MRRTIFCALVVLAIGIISSHVLMAVPQEDEEWKNDDFGTVIGYIVDADNGERVKEYFYVQLLPTDEINEKVDWWTDKNGRFSKKVQPGIYVLFCYPCLASEYSIDPDYRNFPEIRQEIKVEKGKITQFYKKAYRAGKLKIVIVDPTGSKINPKNYLNDVNIGIDLDRILPDGRIRGIWGSPSSRLGHLSEGEYTMAQLYPGIYNMEVDFLFSYLGYPTKRFENIYIEKNEVTEIKVALDLADKTGVYGKVVDLNGNPVEEVSVGVYELDERKDFRLSAGTLTDSNGDFKIIGLREGLYEISFSKMFKPSYISYPMTSETIIIEKNKLIEKKKQIKTPPAEMP